jgi:hypothetical protein
MGVAETSRVAYEQAVKPVLGDQQREVWEALRSLTSATADKLAEYIDKWPQSTVGARLNSLERLGYAMRIGKAKNKSGVLATLWTATSPNDKQLRMIL